MFANLVDKELIFKKIMSKYGVKRDAVKKDLKLAELQMEEIAEQRESDNRHRNIMMARELMQLAINDGNYKEARLCLADVCKLEASYPVKDPAGGVDSLLELARQAADAMGRKALAATEEPSIEVVPSNSKEPPPLPMALQGMVPEDGIDEAEVRKLAEGRLDEGDAKVTRAPSGAVRVSRNS